MSAVPKASAVVGQSGGPTAVINQSLVGVIEEAKKAGYIDQILGARFGVRGIIDDKFVPLKYIPTQVLDRVAQTPAAALGSTRDKPDAEYCEKVLKSFQRHDVRYFFYIGGNDSADTARIVSDLARREKYDLRVYHIPKTIDNDLRVHDHTPGFGSAAKFVAAAVMGDNFDNASLPGVKIDVIMGRNAGFLTAASVLARRHDEDGPHLIYVPESPVTEEKFLADVDRVFKAKGRCLVCVSEGLAGPDGKTWTERIASGLDVDMHKNIQLSGVGALADYLADLVKSKLGVKRVRADTFGYLQRSFPGFYSEVDAREARLVGQVAVKLSGDPNITEASVAMRRVSQSPYRIETFATPLHTVARVTRHLDPAWIIDGNNIAPAFKEYAAPLVGDLPKVGSLDEI
ncbi:MAG TPA: 6-phosphofructokinase [Tepidisphaeraceae bacterium]|nr:6-phosphofructokinase [Tepidisphaeraceae bacterium]